MKTLRVLVTDEQYDAIKEKTSDITISEFFRDLLNKQSGVELRINFSDIDSFSEEIEKLVNQISGICAIIYKSNKACENEVLEILHLIQKIDKQSDDIWRYVMDSRTNLYDETRKRLYHSVAENSYKRRRKKRYSCEEKEDG